MLIHSNKTSFVMARSEGYYHLANLKKMTVEKHDSRHGSRSLESLRRWKNRNIRKKSDTVKPANLMITMFSSDLLQWLSQVLINRSDSFFPSHFALNLYTGNRELRPLSSTKVSILQTRIFFYIGRPFMKLPLHISCRQHPMFFWLKGRAQTFGRCGPISRVPIFKLVECELSFFLPSSFLFAVISYYSFTRR